MCSSQGMRENPLAIIITTAGFNKFGFCYEYRNTCTEILSGVKDDDSQFTAIYTLDEDDDWQDENNWLKANPSLGVTVNTDFLAQQIHKAKNNVSLEIGVRTKNLNQWVNVKDVWLSNDLLLKYTDNVNYDDYNECQCYMGVDLSAVSDLTALGVVIPMSDKFYIKVHYYLPQSCLDDNSNAELYKKWKYQGLLTITDGNVTDYDYILKDIKKIGEKLYIQKIAYDSWNATQWAINATTEGLPIEPYSQAIGNFNKPTKEFERLLKNGSIIIDNNEITRWCFQNITLKSDWNENVKPVKNSDQQKIDGAIAAIEALGIYLKEPQYNNVIGYV
jgi:phage terminase large subunit-like protein